MSNSALLIHPCSEWRATNLIQHMRDAAKRSARLHGELRQAPRQRTMNLHLAREVGAGSVRTWLRRRLSTLLGVTPDAGELELCLVRLHVIFESVPAFVAIATLRAIGNAWPTS